MKKFLTFFIKKLPIISLIIITGIAARIVGLTDILITGSEYNFFDAPVYSAALDTAAKHMGVGNAGSARAGISGTAGINADTELADDNGDKSQGSHASQKGGFWDIQGDPESDLQDKQGQKIESDARQDQQEDSGEDSKTSVSKKKLEKLKNKYVSADEQAKLTGKSLDQIIAHRKKVSNNTYIYSKSFPDEATRPVSSAVDYGIADPQYMDPPETVYDPVDKGIFKQNNDYYSFQQVNDSYFDNALFIGDSQTDGLYHYGLIRDHASFYALESITIYNLFDVTIPYRSPTEEFTTTLDEIIGTHSFQKIYLCIGMNELGDPDTTRFREAYMDVIKRIRKAQPKAIIYIQAVTHVSVWYSAYDPAFNNTNIVQRNHAISTLANGHDIFYLDPNEVLCDENGDLDEQYTNDGIHMTAHFYPLWHEYLNKYAIIRNKADR